MNFIEELRWRNMLHDMTPGAEDALNSEMQRGYIGFDPTAPSLTIGNYVQLMLLGFFQRSGHQPIVVMGGATGRVGDPSGKDKERELKSYDELDHNLKFQVEQMKKFLDFDNTQNPAIMVNNLDFYKEMNVLDFLRDVGKTLTVNYMTSKDSVKKRLESGLSFTEFSYQLLQAYDFQCLYDQMNCKFQMGGSDQWGNITSGTEFIRRNSSGKAYAVTTPLLTKADGTKFGKSSDGNIWLDPNLTSPYKFYQYWINSDDQDLSKYLRYFSFRSKEEIEALEKTHQDDPRQLKQILAEELTTRVHSEEAFDAVKQVSEILFNKKASPEFLKGMSIDALKSVSEEIPCVKINVDWLNGSRNILDFLSEGTNILTSKSDVKRAIKNNAISVNKEKVLAEDFVLNSDMLLHQKYLMVENGKKNKFIIEID